MMVIIICQMQVVNNYISVMMLIIIICQMQWLCWYLVFLSICYYFLTSIPSRHIPYGMYIYIKKIHIYSIYIFSFFLLSSFRQQYLFKNRMDTPLSNTGIAILYYGHIGASHHQQVSHRLETQNHLRQT